MNDFLFMFFLFSQFSPFRLSKGSLVFMDLSTWLLGAVATKYEQQPKVAAHHVLLYVLGGRIIKNTWLSITRTPFYHEDVSYQPLPTSFVVHAIDV